MRKNIECAGEDGICMICALGDGLKDDEVCEYANLLDAEKGCPMFRCAEQCRLCPRNCEFYLG